MSYATNPLCNCYAVCCSWNVAVHRTTETGTPTVTSAARSLSHLNFIVLFQSPAVLSALMSTVDFA